MRGFTLTELLIVMLILATAAIVVVVNAPTMQSDLQTHAEQFALSLTIADDEATLSGRALQLVMAEDRYFYQHYSDGEWVAASIGTFPTETALPNGMLLVATKQSVVADNEASLLRPTQQETEDESERVLIDPAGMPASLRAEFVRRNNNRWVVTRDERGEVSVERARN